MSLIEDHSLYSGLTSRTTRSNASTRSRDNCSTDIKITLKDSAPSIKVEGPEIRGPDLLASLDPFLGERVPSFNRNSWDNVSFFGNNTSVVTGLLSRSCNGRLETLIRQPHSPETSQRALRSVRSRNKLAQTDSSENKTPTCSDASSFRSERSSLQSPGSSSPKLHDEGDRLFETPKASTGQPQYQLTPPTPLSTYGAQSFPFGEDSGSPIRTRRQRPAPSPVQPSKEEAKIQCRGLTKFQPMAQDETRLRDTSAQSWASIDHSRLETTSEGGDEETSVQPKLETKREIGTASGCDVPNNTSSSSLSTLVKGIDVLGDIFGYNILSRLKEDPKHCVDDLKSKRGRCSRHLKKNNDKIAYIQMDELRSLRSLSDVATKLEALVPLMFCGRSHLSGAKTRVASWQLDNQGANIVRAVYHELPRDDIDKLDGLTGRRSIVDKTRVVKEQDIIPPQVKKDVIRVFSVDTSFSYSSSTTKLVKPSSYKTTIRQLVPWQPVASKKDDVKTALLASITHSLGKQGDIAGYLYVYSTVGDFGARKIGVTSIPDIEQRMDGWRKQCQRRIDLIYPQEGKEVLVPHVYRLEMLVHTELKEYRLVEHGCGCGVQRHREWFNAKTHHIQEVVRRWTEWLLKKPYEKQNMKWVLKKEFQDLDEICTPYTPQETELALQGKTDSRKRVPVTRNLTPQRRSSRIAQLRSGRGIRSTAAE
ncbi:hypothetical protein MMC17_009454 [Xylographa soralifera]|nr:hypothetical protein [Xylographa soralifera]